MIKQIHICDKCGAEETTENTTKPKYRAIQISAGDFGTQYIDLSRYSIHSEKVITYKSIYVCPKCQAKLGIKENIQKMSIEEKQNASEKIMEMIVELVKDHIQEPKD